MGFEVGLFPKNAGRFLRHCAARNPGIQSIGCAKQRPLNVEAVRTPAMQDKAGFRGRPFSGWVVDFCDFLCVS